MSPISCHKLNTHPDTLIKLFIHSTKLSGLGKKKEKEKLPYFQFSINRQGVYLELDPVFIQGPVFIK